MGPFGSQIRDRAERWLGDGVRTVLVWQALADAGFGTREDLERRLAVDYARTVDEAEPGDIEWNLEKLDDSSADTEPARNIMAPIAVLDLGRELRRATGNNTARSTTPALGHPPPRLATPTPGSGLPDS